MVTFELPKWFSKLKPFCSDDETREPINAPWFEVKDGNLYLAATNGHMVVIVHFLEGQLEGDLASDFDLKKDAAYPMPFDIWKRAEEIRITPAKKSGDFSIFETKRHGSNREVPDIWAVIPSWIGGKAKETKGKKSPLPMALNAKYLKAIGALFESVGTNPRTHQVNMDGRDALDPFTYTAEHQGFRVLVVVMPMRMN